MAIKFKTSIRTARIGQVESTINMNLAEADFTGTAAINADGTWTGNLVARGTWR